MCDSVECVPHPFASTYKGEKSVFHSREFRYLPIATLELFLVSRSMISFLLHVVFWSLILFSYVIIFL